MPRTSLPARPLAAVAGVAVVAAGLGAYFGITAARGGPASSSSAAEPSPRTGAALAYDPVHGDTVLFGGSDTTMSPPKTLGDTWTWDGSAWTERHPATSPPATALALMAYDPAGHVVVLVTRAGPDGAVSSSAPPGAPRTWLWDGATWREANGTTPDVSGASHIATDSATSSVILVAQSAPAPQPLMPCHSGPEPAEPLPNVCLQPYNAGSVTTWRWDGDSWRKAGAAPDAVTGLAPVSALVTDPSTGHAELFSTVPSIVPPCAVPLPATDAYPAPCLGLKGDGGAMPAVVPRMSVRRWTGSGWSAAQDVAPPDSGRSQGTLVADPGGHRVLWLSSFDGTTWAFDGNAWTRLSATLQPAPALAAAASGADGHPLLFGGMVTAAARGTAAVSGQTWSWDGAAWKLRGGKTAALAPPAAIPGSAAPSTVVPGTVVPVPAITGTATPA